MFAQGIATAIATYKVATNGNARNSRNGSDTLIVNQKNPRHYSYKEFMVCKPRSFYNTERAIGLSNWIEKIKALFCISSCPDNYRVKYVTCTLMDSDLTGWNNRAKSMGINEACVMGWEPLT